VELVRGQLLALFEQQRVLLRRQRHVAEPAQLARVPALAGQHARHGVRLSARLRERVQQIEEPAALGEHGHPGLRGLSDGPAHAPVPRERPGPELGVAAAKIQGRRVLGQRRVLDGRKLFEPRAELFQQREILAVVEAEGAVARDRDDGLAGDPLRQRRGLRLEFRRVRGQGEQRGDVRVLLEAVRDAVELFQQVLDLRRRDEPQMAALERKRLVVRQKTQHGHAALPLDERLHERVLHGGAAVQQHRADAAVGPEGQKAGDERAEGDRRPPRVDEQHGGCLGRARKVPGRGAVGRAAQPVVIAHDALEHRKIAAPAALQQ